MNVAGRSEGAARTAGTRGAVFTVPSGRPFLIALAGAILKGDLPRHGGPPPDILDLPATTILLPNRRSARALQQAFLAASGGRALLLPAIRPIAEANEELALLTALSGPEAFAPGEADVPPAVSEIERRLALTGMVLRWSQLMRKPARTPDGELEPYAAAGAETAAQAARLAAELSRLIDDVETENVSLARLKGLVPDAFSAHWQKTLQFLDIVLAWWPAHLAEKGLISPVDRRNRLLRAEARRLAARPPAGPVIVAGVTGSIPASAELLRVVASLDQGAIVLPGLDQQLDAASWQAIAPGHPEHPQFGLKRLLEALGVAREDVRVLPGAEPGEHARARARFISEALRPAATTDRWHTFLSSVDRDQVRDALKGIACLEAPDAEAEAEAIALIMREAAETPGRTAALVARDRLLARRVATRLESWGIRVDDSAGRPLAKTMPGVFLDLVIEAHATGLAPAPLMALLKHPLTRLGLAAGEIRRTARALEIAAFRTPYLGRGLDGIEAALERAAREVAAGARREQAVRRLSGKTWQEVRDLLQRLRSAFGPLAILCSGAERVALGSLLRAHIDAAEALAMLPDRDAACALWDGEAGEAASLFLAHLLDASLPPLDIAPAEYPDLYRSLVGGETVRPRVPVHPRLSIWGPLEARLQQPDIVILGGLNEGTWPEPADPGPWLNRPMRQALGLAQPEERIGYAAHDFASLCGAGTVYLTRAQKIDGVPAVPSRWLLRLQALLDGLGLADAVSPEQPWLAWAAARNDCRERVAIGAPEPRPAVQLRPRQLSVSDVERWIANPYAIFAGKILRLEPLPVLGAEPDAALRGAIIHEALSRFAQKFPDRLPDDPARELVRLAEETLADYAGSPRVAAFWVPRFERFAAWFAETEPARRAGVIEGHAEVTGAQVLDGPAGPFTLKARADRIDVRADGIIITDYKSGANLKPLAARALNHEAPQLALEAAIALAGGFAGIETMRVAGLRYISASGGEPPGAEIDLEVDDVASLSRGAEAGLRRLISAFDQATTPYRAVRRPRFSYTYDDYAHLARAAEWAGAESED